MKDKEGFLVREDLRKLFPALSEEEREGLFVKYEGAFKRGVFEMMEEWYREKTAPKYRRVEEWRSS